MQMRAARSSSSTTSAAASETLCVAGCRLHDPRAPAVGSIAEEGEVDSDVKGGLCCNAGCDEIRVEAGVCAQHAEEQGLSAVVQ